MLIQQITLVKAVQSGTFEHHSTIRQKQAREFPDRSKRQANSQSSSAAASASSSSNPADA
jgi:hypothetical protein